MTDKLWLLDTPSMERTRETNRRVLGALPRAPQRRRRVYDGNSGSAASRAAQIVKFTIDAYDYVTGIATCFVEYRPYGVNQVSDETVDGTIEVVDPTGCFFNEDEPALIGRWGDAAYMQPNAAVDPLQPGTWVVTGLCCPGV